MSFTANQILGLVSGANFETEGWYNRTNRRRIFRDFPQGQFPLTGFLSLMDTEPCDSYKFGWFEKRMPDLSTTIVTHTNGAFCAAHSSTAVASDSTFTAGTEYRCYLSDVSLFAVGQQVLFDDLPITGGAFAPLQGIVTSVVSTTSPGSYIQFHCVETLTNVLMNDNTITGIPKGPKGQKVLIMGTANVEGGTSGSGRMFPPIDVENYTQIFRNSFEFTATGLKIPTEFDSSGAYAEAAEDALREHMVEMELAFLFGSKGVQLITGTDSVARPRRTTGGIIWYLKQWEKVDSIYRLGTGAPAVTRNDDDLKRIIDLTGAITAAKFDEFIERAFRCTNTKTFEKIVMCGNGFLRSVNNYLSAKATLYKEFSVQKVYGNDVVTWVSPWGTLHFKSHPLFNQQSILRNNGLIIDINRLRFRPLNDRDTTLLPNRQANDVDGRKDEWLTEAGLETQFPESHMYIRNLTSIT